MLGIRAKSRRDSHGREPATDVTFETTGWLIVRRVRRRTHGYERMQWLPHTRSYLYTQPWWVHYGSGNFLTRVKYPGVKACHKVTIEIKKDSTLCDTRVVLPYHGVPDG